MPGPSCCWYCCISLSSCRSWASISCLRKESRLKVWSSKSCTSQVKLVNTQLQVVYMLTSGRGWCEGYRATSACAPIGFSECGGYVQTPANKGITFWSHTPWEYSLWLSDKRVCKHLNKGNITLCPVCPGEKLNMSTKWIKSIHERLPSQIRWCHTPSPTQLSSWRAPNVIDNL